MSWQSLTIALILCAPLPFRVLGESHAALSRALDSITLGELDQHTETLASDSFEGREAGSDGGRATATYLVNELRKAQLRPAGSAGTYFQTFRGAYRNVLAVIPGADPVLRQEYLLVSAHYDHVGYGTRKNSNGPVGYIHNGADDNASGVAVLLELAEALQQHGPTLPRSVLCVWWDAEEKGLWGSKHWLQHPTVPLDRIKLMLNVDMVGRLRETLQLHGTRSMPGLRSMWARANLVPQLQLDFPWRVLDNSDHYPFFEHGIPITMLHTGLHDDYHRPSDDASLLNVQGVREVSELLLRLVVQAARIPQWEPFREASYHETESERQEFERPRKRLRLGIAWHDRSTDAGLSVSQVVQGSPAEEAGLVVGDRVTHVNDERLQDTEQLRRAVAATFGILRLELNRDGQVLRRDVSLGGTRPRFGFRWRTDEAEPRQVVISDVIPDSPAEQAGLRPLDRIQAVRGRTFASEAEFQSQLIGVDGPLDLLIERNGRLHPRNLELPAGPRG